MEREVSEAERRMLLKKSYSQKIGLLLNKDVSDKELYSVIRSFFSEFLKLDYEFTYEELSQELNKIFIKQVLKGKIDRMLEDLTILEYTSGVELDQVEKKKILSDFRDVIDQLIIDLESTEKKGFFEKLFAKKKENQKPQLGENPASNNTAINSIDVKKDVNSSVLDLVDVKEKNIELLRALNSGTASKNDFALNTDDLSSLPELQDFSNSRETGNVLLFQETSSKENSSQRKNFSSSKNIEPKSVPEKISLKKNSNKYEPSKKERSISGSLNNNSFENAFVSRNYLEVEVRDEEIIAIKTKIEECYNEKLTGDIDGAKKKYMSALNMYNKLPYDKQTKLYIELHDLYLRLK